MPENISVNQDWLNANLPMDFCSLLQVGGYDELQKRVVAYVQAMGFGGFLFSRWTPDPAQPGAFLYSAMTSFSDGWMEKYFREKFYMHDPVLLHCHRSWHPLPWTSALFATPETRPIYEEARLHGISAGCGVPISPASGGFSFVRDEDPDAALPDVLRVLPSMALLSGFVMEATRLIEAKKVDQDLPERLSKREIECLKLMAAGFRDSDIADRLNITLRTVVAHIANARRKIGATNRAQLIARCLNLGIV